MVNQLVSPMLDTMLRAAQGGADALTPREASMAALLPQTTPADPWDDHVRPQTPAEITTAAVRDGEHAAIEHELKEQDRRDAQTFGVSYDDWRLMSAKARDMVRLSFRHNGAEAPSEEATRLLAERGQMANGQRIPSTAVSPETKASSADEFGRRVRELITPDEEGEFTPMCDPPVQWQGRYYHPGVSKIGKKSTAQKYKQGFSFEPRYPFIPRPTIPCPINSTLVSGIGGMGCVYLGRFEEDIDIHVRTAHPQEYETRRRQTEARLAEEARQREQTNSDRQTQLLETLTGLLTRQSEPVDLAALARQLQAAADQTAEDVRPVEEALIAAEEAAEDAPSYPPPIMHPPKYAKPRGEGRQ